jgi:hypothetical protein
MNANATAAPINSPIPPPSEAPRAYDALRHMHCKHRAEQCYAERCTDHAGGIDEAMRCLPCCFEN